MKKLLVSIALMLLNSTFSFAQSDVSGSKDFPLLSRMTGFYIHEYQEKDYERNAFLVPAGTDAYQKKDVEGRLTLISYKNNEGVKASRLQVLKNYVNATKKAGATVMFEDNPALMLFVEGHTDNIGTPDANLKLSDLRAKLS